MTMTYKSVTGRVTIPGTDTAPGGRLRVTATPQSTDTALSFESDDRATWGPRHVETDDAGYLPTGTAALRIPQGSTLGDELLWKITAEPIDKKSPLGKWTVAITTITTDTTIRALAHPDVTMVTPALATTVGENAAAAAASEAAAAASEIAAQGWADAASSSAADAALDADLAAASATEAADNANGFSAGTATTLAPGATPTVSITGTAPSRVINLGIPAGVADDASMTATYNAGGTFKTALNDSFAGKWKASTAYTAGQTVMAPDGSLVKAKTSFTSGTSYSASNWTTVAATAGTQAKSELDAAIGAATAGKLSGVAQGTAPDPSAGVWVDTGSTVAAAPAWRRFVASSTTTGAVNVTLGADPLPNTELVVVAGQVKAPGTGYTITGRVVTITSVNTGDVIQVRYAYDSSTIPGNDVADFPVVSDTFTRADSTSSLGTANTGQAWTALAGPWGISSNQAYLSASGGANAAAVIESGLADCTVQAKLTTIAGSCGLTVRVIDVSNNITANTTALFRKTGGTNNTLVTFSQTFVSGDTMRIVTLGSSIKVYRQAASSGSFTLVGQATEVQGQTATKHGLRSGDTTGANRFDDFLVTY